MNDGDLIRRRALLDKFESMRDNSKTLNRLSRSVGKTIAETTYKAITLCMHFLKEAPTVDAVEVVRCKDCAVPHNKWTGCPNLNGLVPPPEHFCSYGERKDNA